MKVTIETEGQDTVVLEGKGIIGTLIVGEEVGNAVDVHDLVMGEFTMNTMTAGISSALMTFMSQLQRNGFSKKNVLDILNHTVDTAIIEQFGAEINTALVTTGRVRTDKPNFTEVPR